MCGMKHKIKTNFLENVSDWSKIYYENCTITDMWGEDMKNKSHEQ